MYCVRDPAFHDAALNKPRRKQTAHGALTPRLPLAGLAHLSLKVTSVTLPKLPVPRNISVSKSPAVNRVSCSSMKLSKSETGYVPLAGERPSLREGDWDDSSFCAFWGLVASRASSIASRSFGRLFGSGRPALTSGC